MRDEVTGKEEAIEKSVWNATVANLTLMALGSSAPEIFLSIIETVSNLENEPGELGASTIVGSAAFNLLIITAISIVSVGKEPKKIDDVGVFIITACWSMWAYIWLYIVLSQWTPGYVSLIEAIITIVFCALLIITAYVADRYRNKKQGREQTDEKRKELAVEKQRLIAKTSLRQLALKMGQNYVIECARGGPSSVKATPEEKAEIRANFKKALEVDSLEQCDINHLIVALEQENIIERIAYRKATGNASSKSFIKLKGTQQQIEHRDQTSTAVNPKVGFKCMHYSVTESSGFVEITI